MTEYRLSLLAKFDDLGRKRDVLFAGEEDIESAFLKFVWQQEECREKWLGALNGSSKYSHNIKDLEEENRKLETKLKHARNQIDHEMRQRVRIEEDKAAVERNIRLVRDILVDKDNQSVLNARDREKLAFLSTDFQGSHYYDSPNKGLTTIEESASLLSPDISYDKTGDDLDNSYHLRSGQKKKRPSAPPLEEDTTPPGKRQKDSPAAKSTTKTRRSKKHRRSNSASVITTTSVTVKDGHMKAKSHITRDGLNTSLKKYPSAGDIKLDSEEEASPNRYGKLYTPGSPTLYRTSSSKSLNRPHYFVTKTVIKPEQCVWCGKKIKFSKAAMKCRDCKATAHPECKEQVPVPCVPRAVTPNNNRTVGCVLADYAPSQPPYIPALVIHCVNEIQERGFSEEGIYRKSGSEREIRELKERFLRGRGTPNLNNVSDIHVICGCLKDFLRGLKESLLTFALWDDFVKAAQQEDEDERLSGLYQAISQLPKANRDTLAFMIIHLQRVTESPDCCMGVKNLSRVFGPTIVGYSCPEPEPLQMINETHKQQMVVEGLMGISVDYWEKVMTFDDMETPQSRLMPNTPDGGLHSVLGPLGTPGETAIDNKSVWYTPRFGSCARSNVSRRPNHFFQSPTLK